MLLNLVLASLPLLLIYLLQRLYYRRIKEFAEWPQLPTSLVWGHAKALHGFIQAGEPKRHIDIVLSEIRESLGNPAAFILDVRPAQRRPLGVICSHEVAEQVSRSSKAFPYSMAKSPTMAAFVDVLGPRSIISSQGEKWKGLRKRFNPGFAPQHLLRLLPCILDRAWRFLQNLDALAATGEEFTLDELCINLTFDIIGAVTMDEDFRAQLPKDQQSEIVSLYRQLVTSYNPSTQGGSFQWGIPYFSTTLKRRSLSNRVDSLLRQKIREKFTEKQRSQTQTQQSETKKSKSRSILSLSLQDIDDLTPSILAQTSDQLKSFLFAGHDTTSILLQWAFYELSRTPRALNSTRNEVTQIFGPDPSPEIIKEALLSEQGGDALIQRMSYISAVIKEILRLYPPSGTARYQPPGSGFMVTLPDGKSLCLDGAVVYNCDTIVQRDEAVYGATKDEFYPERWLGDTDTSMATNSDNNNTSLDEKKEKTGRVPASAWRPFERGPRNCIGQELANLEARVVLACSVCRYDFTKVGRGAVKRGSDGKGVVNGNGQFEVVSEMYNTMQVTAKPVDGMRMRVSLVPGTRALDCG